VPLVFILGRGSLLQVFGSWGAGPGQLHIHRFSRAHARLTLPVRRFSLANPGTHLQCCRTYQHHASAATGTANVMLAAVRRE
jgi:hypothetical protein